MFAASVHSVCLFAHSHSPAEVTLCVSQFSHNHKRICHARCCSRRRSLFSTCRRRPMLRSDCLISHSCYVADMIFKGFNILSQHPGGGEPTRMLACFHLGMRLCVCARAAGSMDTLMHVSLTFPDVQERLRVVMLPVLQSAGGQKRDCGAQPIGREAKRTIQMTKYMEGLLRQNKNKMTQQQQVCVSLSTHSTNIL